MKETIMEFISFTFLATPLITIMRWAGPTIFLIDRRKGNITHLWLLIGHTEDLMLRYIYLQK